MVTLSRSIWVHVTLWGCIRIREMNVRVMWTLLRRDFIVEGVFKSGCCESSGCGMDFSPGCRAKLCCVICTWLKKESACFWHLTLHVLVIYKVFNYVDKLRRSVNLCSPFSSHIPYSAKQQVLRGSLELRKQWFPGFV